MVAPAHFGGDRQDDGLGVLIRGRSPWCNPVVYDANVLYPAPLRDLLIRLAMTGLFR